jgi:FMN phosphatase YigB (HAD superfamily)
MKKAIIIDIDNTITDAQWRVDILHDLMLRNPDSKDANYNLFHQLAYKDEPIEENINSIHGKTIGLMSKHNNYEIERIFLTGRPERIRGITEKLITIEFGINNIQFIMKKNHDYSKDFIYKKKELDKIKKDYQVLAV